MDDNKPNSELLKLPDVLLMEIFEKLSYDEVANLRIVCLDFNRIGSMVLNAGLKKSIVYHKQVAEHIRRKMPRRESDRRWHLLGRHEDVLNCIETRFSLFQLTYGRYIDMNLCCFIPGRVLDEIRKVLRLLQQTKCALRSYNALQEFRDLSSMAVEHFEQCIVPILNAKLSEINNANNRDQTPTFKVNMIPEITVQSLSNDQTIERLQQIILTVPPLEQTTFNLLGALLSSAIKAQQQQTQSTQTEQSVLRADGQLKHVIDTVKQLENEENQLLSSIRALKRKEKRQDRIIQALSTAMIDMSQKVSNVQQRTEYLEAEQRKHSCAQLNLSNMNLLDVQQNTATSENLQTKGSSDSLISMSTAVSTLSFGQMERATTADATAQAHAASAHLLNPTKFQQAYMSKSTSSSKRRHEDQSDTTTDNVKKSKT